MEGIPGAIKGENATSYIYYGFGIDIFSDGGFNQGIDNQGTANGNWVYASILILRGLQTLRLMSLQAPVHIHFLIIIQFLKMVLIYI